MTALYELTTQYRSLERLAETDDLPSEVVRDTLEGLTGEIELKAQNVAAFIRNLDATAEAIDGAIEQMKARRDRLRARSEQVRAYLLENMVATGITKIECPYFRLAVHKSPPKVVIDNAGAVPSDLYVYPEPPPPYPDKKAILARIKSGEIVPGAHVEQGEHLRIV